MIEECKGNLLAMLFGQSTQRAILLQNGIQMQTESCKKFIFQESASRADDELQLASVASPTESEVSSVVDQ